VQASPAGDSLIGLSLADKYRVLRQIGRGGMGVVYEAEHVGLGKRVAIKLMLEKYADDTEARSRFHREALAAGKIGNPHIIEIFDIGTAPDGRSFVAMELLNGFPLSKVIEMSGAMQPWRAVQIMRQVLRAVGAAHAKGIIHRDLKPDNIFLVNQSEDHDFVKLLDFGISKVVSLDEQVQFTKLTSTGVVMGTPLYMAPEQALGNPTERHADIYACGVILYEMLAGHPPFQGPTYAVLVSKLLTEQPPPIGQLRPGLPASLVRAVHRALEKEPSDRFASAEAFSAALPSGATPSQLELGGTIDSGIVAAVPTPARPGRFRNVAIASVAFTLAAAATAVVLVVTNDEPAPVRDAPGQLQSAPQGRPDERTAPPQPAERTPSTANGVLEVKSTPTGAAVFVDDRLAGTTPINVTVTAGRHQVRLELAGYASVTVEEDARANERSSVMVPLARAEAKPRGAPVTQGTPTPPPGPALKTVKRPADEPKPVQAPQQQGKPTPPATTAPPATPTPPAGDAKKPGSTPGAKPNPYGS
jgi:serine/threonine-protein kinase